MPTFTALYSVLNNKWSFYSSFFPHLTCRRAKIYFNHKFKNELNNEANGKLTERERNRDRARE